MMRRRWVSVRDMSSIQSDLYCEKHQPKVVQVPIPLWCLSFVDENLPEGSRFVGACYVPAWNHEQAKLVAQAMGCAPERCTEIAMGFLTCDPPSGIPIGKLITNRREAQSWADTVDIFQKMHALLPDGT